jgi:hypothetical protein
MPEGFKSIIAQLEQQKAAIQRALDALREVDEIGDATVTPTPQETPGPSGQKHWRNDTRWS